MESGKKGCALKYLGSGSRRENGGEVLSERGGGTTECDAVLNIGHGSEDMVV